MNSTTCPKAHQFKGMIHYGYATGHLRRNRWDNFAPMAGLPFCQELRALETHLAVFGSSGQGKTSAVIKPTVYQYLRAKWGGAFLICGKGALAAEFLGLRNYLCLSPDRCKVGLMEGLSPHQAMQAITEINVRPGDKGNSENPIWNNVTKQHMRHAIYLLEALVEINKNETTRHWFWDLWDWARVCNLPESDPKTLADYVAIVSQRLPRAKEGMLAQALAYFETGYAAMDDKLREGARTQAETWFGGILSHPLLLGWAQAETGVNPEVCLRADEKGEYWTVGCNLPKVIYDDAGTLATAFIKGRIYARIKERAAVEGGWHEADPRACNLLMVQDEFQLIATESDYDIAPIARSLGCMLLIASQTIESVRAKSSNKDNVEAFFDAFQSRIALSTSIETVEWLQRWQGFGKAWIPQLAQTENVLDMVASAANALRSPLFERNHPDRKWFQRLQRKGLGGFRPVGMSQVQSQRPMTTDSFEANTLLSNHNRSILLDFEPVTGRGWKEETVLQLADFASLTKEKGVALCSVLRAGVVRRDFVRLIPPEKGIPADLRDPNYVSPLAQKEAA
jgi:hypothetical protein